MISHRQRRRQCESRGEGSLKMQPQAKEDWSPSKAGKGKERILPWGFWKEGGPARTLILAQVSDLGLPVPRTVRECISFVLSHHVCGTLLYSSLRKHI